MVNIAVADGTGAALDTFDSALLSQYHFVPNSISDTRPDLAKKCHDRGIFAVFDIEEIWMRGEQKAANYRPQLQAIKNANWDAISFEGFRADDVQVIEEYVPAISYGGGSTAGQIPMYSAWGHIHHAANYLEIYTGDGYSIAPNLDAVLGEIKRYTPNDTGLLIPGNWNVKNTPLSSDFVIGKLKQFNLNVLVIWAGIGASLTPQNNTHQYILDAVVAQVGVQKSYPSFAKPIAPPTPEPGPSKPVASFNVYIARVEKGHIRITFFSAAEDGSPANNNPVVLNNLWPARKPTRLAAGKTGADGAGWAAFDLHLPEGKYLFEIVSGDIKQETSWVDLA